MSERTEENLRRYKLLCDHSRDVVLFMRRDDGRILDANAAAIKTYGYSHEEFLSLTIHDLRADRTQEMAHNQMDRADTQGILFEAVHRRKDGSTVPVEVSSQGATIDGTRTLISVIRDISERKRLEEELRRLNLNLEEQVRVRTRQLTTTVDRLRQMTLELSQAEDREHKRLAEVLHDDLQQLLAAAKFQVGLLSNRTRSDDGVQAMTRQVKDLLAQAIDQSRSLSHELSPPALRQSDLCEAFEWLAENLRTKHGLLVQIEACEPVNVYSEPLKVFLFKAVQELLFNVVKHSHVKEARLRLQNRRGHICLSVADSGVGFDVQSIAKSGFGLLSIRERVKLLGGRMRLISRPGSGSMFLIKVPVPQFPQPQETQWIREPSAAKIAAEKKRRERSHEPGLRVLLVDDHKIVREGLEAMLIEESDIKVVGQAGNGREAVEMAHRLQPDVIVMDVSMPVMAGDEATRRIKSQWPYIRVIALSMFDDPRTADRMRKAGATAYLLKTAPSEELLAAIRGSEAVARTA